MRLQETIPPISWWVCFSRSFPHCCDCPSTCAQHHLLEGALLAFLWKKPYGFLRRATEGPALLPPFYLHLAQSRGACARPHFVHGGGPGAGRLGHDGRAVRHHSVRKVSLETLGRSSEVGGLVSSVHLGVYTLIPGLI